jgi:predicted N-acetyltransferase YhbS
MATSPLVETARPDDLPAIAQMRVAEDWQANRWLIDAVHGWDGGRLFVVRGDAGVASDDESGSGGSRFLAATSAVAYGDLGFIGNVIVHPAARRRGLGGIIMRTAVDWLAGRGVRGVELDATVHGRPLYQRLGFVGTVPSWVLWSPLDAAVAGALRELAGTHRVEALDARGLDSIAALDRMAFGGQRLGLLERVIGLADTRAYVAREDNGGVVGHLFVRPLEGERTGLRLGPWVAQTPHAAAALLAYALETEAASADAPYVQACIPGASRAALDFCTRLGLTLIQDDLRMRLELPPSETEPAGAARNPEERSAGQPDWIYGMLAPMVG